MLDIKELEKRWFKYKIKSYIPFSIIITLVIIVLIIIFVSTSNQEDIKTNNSLDSAKSQQHQPVQEKTAVAKESPQSKKPTPTTSKTTAKESISASKKTILHPSLQFIDAMKTHNSEDESIYKINIKKQHPVERSKKENTIEVEDIKTEIVQDNMIQIKRQNTQSDIQHVIKRFKKSNNPALSLFVAKKYYELKNYEQSYNYALITNNINNNIEDSWIIFAKSLLKLGKEDEAIKTLTKYIDYSHSNRATILLKNIKSGKIK